MASLTHSRDEIERIIAEGAAAGLAIWEAQERVRNAAPDLLEASRPFNLTDWLTTGVLANNDPRTDGLKVNLSIEGTTYEATVTVGDLRRLSAAIAKAEGITA